MLHTLELELGRVTGCRDCNIALFEHDLDELCTETGGGACDKEDTGTHGKSLCLSGDDGDSRDAK